MPSIALGYRRSLASWGIFALLSLSAASCQAASSRVQREAHFERFRVGEADDKVTRPTPGLMLGGGGTDVDDGMRWLLARSGGGDVVILRASGGDGYNPYLMDLGQVNSVETILLKDRQASYDQRVVSEVSHAEAIFIAGGDQSNYINYWKGTPLMDAVNERWTSGVPIGGTSAGLAVLGQFVFSAQHDSAVSDEALRDPYYQAMTLDRDFLRLDPLRHIITDSHFVTRDRMGRLIAFMARISRDGWDPQVRGIGIDEKTAVVVDASGGAEVVGSGAAYFLKGAPPQNCRTGEPLTDRGVQIYRLSAGASFDIPTWSGDGGIAYSLSAESGRLTTSQPNQSIY